MLGASFRLRGISGMNFFTGCFVILLAISVRLRVWLAHRQVGYLKAHGRQAPGELLHCIDDAARQRAVSYTVARIRFNLAYDITLAGLLLLGTLAGGLQRIGSFLGRHISTPYWQDMALVALAWGIWTLVVSAFAGCKVFGMDARFGFNRMTLVDFLSDRCKQAALQLLLLLPASAAVLWGIAALGSYWWLYAGAGWAMGQVLVMQVYPGWIAPLFNRFTPLANGGLKVRLDTLLSRCGFRASGVLVMDGSRRSSHGNAYFAGLGPSRRIILFDTLLGQLKAEEIEAVLAHEIGHFKCGHVVKYMLASMIGWLVALWVFNGAMQQSAFFRGLGVATPGTGMAILLFFVCLHVVNFFLKPVKNYFLRQFEYEADAYAAGVASAQGLVSALLQLSRNNAAPLANDPVYAFFFHSHPSVTTRVARLQAAGAVAG